MPKKIVEDKTEQMPETRQSVDIQVNKFTVLKGVTLPMEKYGGEKYEMMRLDVGLEVLGEATRENLDKAWTILDDELNKQFNDEVEGIKKKG